MTAVVDASAAILLLLNPSTARSVDELARAGSLHAPNHFDIECMSALRRAAQLGTLDRSALASLGNAVMDLPVTRHSLQGLVPRMVELLDNASMYDAAYVALAEGLEAELWTADHRLARIPSLRCAVHLL